MSNFAPTFLQVRRYFESRLPGQRIGSRREVYVKCRFHDDRTASMSVNLEKATWFCHACNTGGGILDFERKLTGKSDAECWDAINETIGRQAPKPSKREGKVVATYDYPDASGKLAFQVLRYEPKTFRQRRPDGNGGFIWNMDGETRYLFNLPALVRANVILLAEGEKDALNLQSTVADFPNEDGKLAYAATCNSGGAGKWSDSYSHYLSGKRVFIFADNDEPGRRHAEQVAYSVSKFAQGIHIVSPPGLAEHGDVSDYLESHTPADLFELMKTAPVWTAPVAVSAPSMTPAEAGQSTAELLETCQRWIRRYVVVSQEQAIILAAWILHTYAFDAAETTPYIHVTAPEKECGKSLLMEVLCAIAFNPIRSGGMSAAALVRAIEAKKPTIFLDEMDAQLGGDKDFAEAIRGILNEGFRKGGIFYKCVGNNFELKGFNVYCPKCFAGIGQLPDTVRSRSIVIEMRRKLPDEIVDPFRQRAVAVAAKPIRTALEAWASHGVVNLLQGIEPAPIASLGNRQNDIAEPLLCIAQLAGDEWLQNLTKSLQIVLKSANADDTSIGATLLADIRAVFDERKTDVVPSKVLAASLCEIEGRPWAEWSHGKGLSANNLARQLSKFSLYPLTIRVGGDTPKGYRRADFEEAWSRYCPLPGIQNATPPQPAPSLSQTTFSNRNTSPSVAVAKSSPNPHEQRIVAAVAVAKRDEATAGGYIEGVV